MSFFPPDQTSGFGKICFLLPDSPVRDYFVNKEPRILSRLIETMALVKSISLGFISVAAVLLVMAVLVRLLEDWITFHPWRELEFVPENFGLPAEELRIRSGQADTIHGWYFRPGRVDAPVILFFHGNAGNISHRLELVAPFVRRGLGVLLFDYRGFGLSTGKPSEKAFQQDALAVWDYLTRVKGIAAERLVSFGRSLGGAPAAYLAAGRQVGWLVLAGSFTSGRDMARQIFGFLPVYLVMKNSWEVSRTLKRVQVPVMILHGRLDGVVPFSLGEKLAREGSAGQVVFWAVEGGGHLDLYAVVGESYYERIEKFLGSR